MMFDWKKHAADRSMHYKFSNEAFFSVEKLLHDILLYLAFFLLRCVPLGLFKENTGATDSIFILNGLIDKAKAYSGPLFVCFIDFKSAFDLVNRSALLYKLLNYGISRNFFAVIRSMLKNASSRVKWNGELGNIFENVNGLLQGGALWAQLYSIYSLKISHHT